MTNIEGMHIAPIFDHPFNHTLMFGQRVWTVTFATEIKDTQSGGDCAGITYGATNSIFIEDGLGTAETIRVYFHELTHAILNSVSYYYPSSDEEYTADHMGIMLPQILPQLPEWVKEGMQKQHSLMVKYVRKNFKPEPTLKSPKKLQGVEAIQVHTSTEVSDED